MRAKRVLFALVLLVVLGISFGCEGQQSASAAAEKNLAGSDTVSAAGKISFKEVTHDFGDVIPDGYSNCTFKFSNTGQSTLNITKTKGTCKCTVPKLKKKEYAPGESGEITVRFHAPKYNGKTSQHIFVSSDDPDNPKVELTIKANVKTYVKADPDIMTLSLVEANAGAGAITVSSIDGEKFAITKIDTGKNEAISIDFDPANIAQVHVLEPKIDSEKLKRRLNGAIVITVNHTKTKSLRVSYNCMKEFEASPSSLILRNAKPGVVQKRQVYLTSNYNQDIEIESVTTDKGIVKVVGQNKTENRFEFDVEITPPDKTGKMRYFSDVLRIKIKNKAAIVINCRGFYGFGKVK